MNENQYYAVILWGCSSKTKTNEIFSLLFDTTQKPNLIKIYLNAIFSFESWKMFTALKWDNLQNLTLSIKYVIKLISNSMTHVVNYCQNAKLHS